jgi:hypothetical protein
MSISIDGNSAAALIAAVGSVATAIIAGRNGKRLNDTKQKVQDVHDEVSTSNGHTLGQLVEQNLPPTLDNSPAAVRTGPGAGTLPPDAQNPGT